MKIKYKKMNVLLNRKNDIYDLVHNAEIMIGDEFFDDTISQPPRRVIVEIFEQRPERGTYKDESNRRIWAKIKSKLA